MNVFAQLIGEALREYITAVEVGCATAFTLIVGIIYWRTRGLGEPPPRPWYPDRYPEKRIAADDIPDAW